MSVLDIYRVNRLVLSKQHMANDSKSGDIIQITEDLCGLHATDALTPYLSLLARTCDFEKEDLYEALYSERVLGRIRCMRRTLHILTEEKIPIVYAATVRMIQKAFKRHMEVRGVSAGEYRKASKSILDLLKDGGMTTSEIRRALQTRLDVSAILLTMCDQGILIRGEPRGGWRSRNHRYFILGEYLPGIDLGGIDEMEAMALLVRDYINAFGPVTERDIAWWTGLNKTTVREALSTIREQVEPVEIDGIKGEFMMLSTDMESMQAVLSQKIVVNVLPLLDPCLMGYKDRERYLADEYYGYVFDRSGNATSTVLVDGKVVGVWDFTENTEAVVKLCLFEKVEKDVLKKIHARAKETGRFMAEGEVPLRECDSMVPLTQRTAGGFMSPLRNS